jgi:hypothetical protein
MTFHWEDGGPLFFILLAAAQQLGPCSLAGRCANTGYRTDPPGYISWRNRLLGSLDVLKFGLWIVYTGGGQPNSLSDSGVRGCTPVRAKPPTLKPPTL